MLRSQRIFLIVGLLLIAGLLNLGMCDWVFHDTVSQARVGDGNPEHMPVFARRHSDGKYTGVITAVCQGYPESLALGVALPLLLVLFAGYLILGARADSRAKRGQCLTCGYDLRAAPGPLAKCPECGTPAPMIR